MTSEIKATSWQRDWKKLEIKIRLRWNFHFLWRECLRDDQTVMISNDTKNSNAFIALSFSFTNSNINSPSSHPSTWISQRWCCKFAWKLFHFSNPAKSFSRFAFKCKFRGERKEEVEVAQLFVIYRTRVIKLNEDFHQFRVREAEFSIFGYVGV